LLELTGSARIEDDARDFGGQAKGYSDKPAYSYCYDLWALEGFQYARLLPKVMRPT
jgi:hypothetical protein